MCIKAGTWSICKEEKKNCVVAKEIIIQMLDNIIFMFIYDDDDGDILGPVNLDTHVMSLLQQQKYLIWYMFKINSCYLYNNISYL